MDEVNEIVLQEYVATANNPKYNQDWDIIDSKFPELEGVDKTVLKEYVATANNPEYKGDYSVINSKFPEFFGSDSDVKKKEVSTSKSPTQDGVSVSTEPEIGLDELGQEVSLAPSEQTPEFLQATSYQTFKEQAVREEEIAPVQSYEENQKTLSNLDKAISAGEMTGMSAKDRMLLGVSQGRIDQRVDELKTQREAVAKTSDQLVEETQKDVTNIVNEGIGDNWKDFVQDNGVVDVSKVGDFARTSAREYGVPEDGYFFQRVKDAAQAKIELEQIRPTTESILLGEPPMAPKGVNIDGETISIVRKRSVKLDEESDDPSTVLMASHGNYSPPDAEGKFVAFPTIFPKDPKKQTGRVEDWIVAENEDQAYEIAKERGEVLYYDTPEEANAVAEGSWKEEKTKGLYEEMYGVKPEDDAEKMLSREDVQKNLGIAQLNADFSMQMEQLQKNIEKSSGEEIDRINQERYGMSVDDYASSIANDYKQTQESLSRQYKALEDRYAPFINEKNEFTGGPEMYQEYNATLEQLNNANAASNEQYKTQFESLVSQNTKDVASVNNKYNRRFNRQQQEIFNAYKSEYADKAEGINPMLQDRYQKAYGRALEKAMKEDQRFKDTKARMGAEFWFGPNAGELISSGYVNTSSYISGLANNLKSLSRAMGSDGEFWEQVAKDTDAGDVELNGFKDWINPAKLTKSMSYTVGGMTPGLLASIGTGGVGAYAGAGSILTTLAAGTAGWGVESATIVQDAYDQKFKETGSATKAEDAASKSLKGQVMLMPMYALEMVPFFGDLATKLGKIGLDNMAARFAVGGATETIAEMGQEYPQQLFEQAIADDKDLSDAFDYASVKGFKDTFVNVAPTTLLLGGGGAALDIKTSKEDMARSLAMKVKMGNLTDAALEQNMLKMTVNEGQKFAKAFIDTQLRNGAITEEQATKATLAIESSVATIEKGKEYNLDNKNNYILATLDLKLKAAKEKAEAETDPMMKGIAEKKVKKIESQAEQLLETGNADVAVVTYPDNSFDILTHDEARLAMSKDEFMKSFASGDLKVEAMGYGQSKLMSELQEKSKPFAPKEVKDDTQVTEQETVPAKQKGRLTKFSTPQDGIVGEVTYEDGTRKELTQEEYDALEKQEGLFDVVVPAYKDERLSRLDELKKVERKLNKDAGYDLTFTEKLKMLFTDPLARKQGKALDELSDVEDDLYNLRMDIFYDVRLNFATESELISLDNLLEERNQISESIDNLLDKENKTKSDKKKIDELNAEWTALYDQTLDIEDKIINRYREQQTIQDDVETGTQPVTEAAPTETKEAAPKENIKKVYTGRGKKVGDFSDTKGEFIFSSENEGISEWYGEAVTEAIIDTNGFLDLTTPEKKKEFAKDNITIDDVKKLNKTPRTSAFETEMDVYQRILERYINDPFTGGEVQELILKKAKEAGYPGVKLGDAFFGREDISYVAIDKSRIKPKQETVPTETKEAVEEDKKADIEKSKNLTKEYGEVAISDGKNVEQKLAQIGKFFKDNFGWNITYINASKENDRVEFTIDGKQVNLPAGANIRLMAGGAYAAFTMEDVINAKYDAELAVLETELKKQRDAIQEQAAGKVPVQPEAKAGGKVEEGKPEAEPEKPTQKGKEEVSEEEGDAGPVLQEQEETVSTSEDKLREMEANARKKHRLNPVKRNRKLAAVRAVRSAMQSLSGIAPDVKIVVHDNAESYAKAAEEIDRSKQDLSKGVWDPDTNTIHINLDKAGSRTVAHETFHALLFNRLNDEGKIQAASEKLISELRSALRGDAKLTAYLDEFATRYSDQDVISEEQLAELIGIIAENYNSFNARAKRAVENFINTVISALGMDKIEGLFPKKISGNEAADMMTAIGERIAKGEVITEEDVSLIEAPEVEIDEKVAPKSKKQEDIKKKNVAGKKVGKGLSVKQVKGEKVKEGIDNISVKKVREGNPKLYINNANILKDYDVVKGVKEFGDVKTLEQADQIYDIFVNEVSDNLIFLHDQFNPELLDYATFWYDGANQIAQDLASQYDISLEQAAGIIAAQSPQKDWYQNVRLAEMVLEQFKANPVFTQEALDFQKEINERGYKGKSGEKLRKAREIGDNLISALEPFVGQKLNSIPDEIKPYVVRTTQETTGGKDYDVISPDGRKLGPAKKKDGSNAKVAWGSYTEIGKAVSIYLNGSEKNISDQLGVMHKIRNFFNNIADPMSKDNDVTMDTHAVAASLLKPLSGNSTQVGHNFGTGTSNSGPLGIKGVYYAFADAYVKAAEARGLLPREMQSITWEAARGLFTDSFKANKSNVKAINDIFSEYTNGKITKDEARQKLLEAAGGIKDPTWAGPILSELKEDTKQEAVTRRVPRDERGVKRREVKPRDRRRDTRDVSKLKEIREDSIDFIEAEDGAMSDPPVRKLKKQEDFKPKKTQKAYKLFTRGLKGKIYPLFVDANTEVPVGDWMEAVFPDYRFTAPNGNVYVPSRATEGVKEAKATGDSIKIPNQEVRDMLIDAGFLPKGSKASTVKAVAARPGWHAGDVPVATHIGKELTVNGKKYKYRGPAQAWAEVEVPADKDWQSIANDRADRKKDGTINVKTAHVTDEIPFDGFYRYKTNPNMLGNWIISGQLKVIKLLSDSELQEIYDKEGISDIPSLPQLIDKEGFTLADLDKATAKRLKEFYPEKYTEVEEKVGDKVVGKTQPFGKRKKQEGAPMFSGKNRNIIDIANRYIRRKGLDKPVDQEIKKLNTEYAKKMADVYEAAKDEPLKKEVQDAYKALAEESKEQFEILKRAGYKVELWDGVGEPYKGSREMLEDLKKNKHLYVFKTEQGFGEKEITAKDREENPMLKDSGYKDVNGKRLLLNDLFRFVHDAFGHGKLGNSFGPIGEENAWYVHSQMFSPAARRAMTSETRGQNSWVNFGPQLRNKDGSLPKKGDKNYVPLAKRDFAEQKNFLFPDEYVFDRPNTQGRFEESGKKPKLKKQEVAKNSKASVDAIKKVPLKEEDGVTLNVDGTPYQGGGLIVPFESINLNQPSITPQDISTFVDERSGKISSDSFKVGLYKFPEESTVSIDLNVVVPSENRKVAVEFAKFLGQESVYDIDTGENIKTGATGMETLTLTNEETIEAEKALMENKMPKFKKKKQEDVKQRGFFTNKFDSVKNWLETRSGQEGIVDHILENPETYYTKQKLSEIEDKLKFMTESQLVEAMSTDALYNLTNRATSSFNTLQGGPAVPENIGILAAVENINRKLEKNQPIDSDVIMLGKFGTALGQLLRQMGHIKSSTPAGALLVIEKIADKYNVSLTKENRRVLEGKIKDRFAITSEIDKLVEKIRRKDITDSEFKDLDKKIKDLKSDLENVHTFTQRYLAKAIPLPFFKAFGVMLQGALLTTGSIVTNFYANVFQTGQFLGTNVLASTAEMARRGTEKVFGLKPKERNFSVSIGGILYASQTGIGSLPNIFRTLFWKGPKEDYIELQHADIRSNILGWRALTVLFSRKMALPTPKEGNTIDKIIGKFNKELGEKKLAAKFDIFLSLLSQGTMGIYPDASFRALQAGDLLFKVPWKNFSLYEKARRKGLKGAELKAFLKYPDKKSYDEAVQLAKEATFQEESKIAELSSKALASAMRYAEKIPLVGGLAHVILRTAFPYVKTPANIINLTLKTVFPELTYATSAYHFAKGNYRQGAMNFGIATTGIMMTSAASMLVANGLVQDSGEDDDADERGQKYIVFPPNTINITAFNRVKDWIKEGYDTSDTEFINRLNMLYKGEAPKELTNPRVTDVKRNYMKSGIPGAVVGIYAQTRAETIKEANSKDLLNPSKKGYFSALGRDVLNLPSVVSYMTQQSFLQGAYGLMNALAGSDHETKMWYLNTFKAVSSVPLPNQLSVINRAEREYLPDFRHRDWKEQFKNVLLDKTFGTSALPVRRDMWGRRIRQTPEGVNPVVFQYGLDPTRPYKGKESPTDEDKMVNAVMEELYTLWDRTRDSKIYPDPVDDRQSLKWKGESRGIYFSPQSKNDYQMIVGGARLNRVVNELSNKNKRIVWDRMTDDQKINKLSKLYMVNDVIVKEIPQEIRDRYGITQKSPTIEKIKIFISQHELMKMIEEGREIE